MKTGSSPRQPLQSGAALMAVLFMIPVMAAAVAAVYSVTTAEGRLMRRSVDRARAVAYGDAVVQYLFDEWRMGSSQTQDATQRSSGFTANEMTGASSPAMSPVLAAPTSTELPAPTGISLVSWSVYPTDPLMNQVADANTRPIRETGTFSRMRIRTYYMCQVKVSYGADSVVIRRPFMRIGRNIFDNFLFSTQPITEIHPGAAMYVNGTVYAGGDLYTGTSNLNFLQDVSYTGSWSIGYVAGDPHASTPSSPTWPSNNPPHTGAQQKLLDTPISSLDPHFTDGTNANDTDSDSNLNNDGYHEIVEEHVSTGSTGADPLQTDASGGSERMADNADYRIYIDASNNVTIYKGTANATTGVASYAQITSGTDYTALMGAITTNTVLSDGREGDNVRLVNVDVGKITTAVNTSSSTYDGVGNNDGLLLYISDTSAGTSVTTHGYSGYSTTTTAKGNLTTQGGSSVTSSRKRGIRLVNGGSLPNVGLSVATPNPVYIQGDYNSGASTNYSASTTATASALSVSNLPASDASGAYPSGTSSPTETSGTYTKKMAAVVADSVTILSNSWSDGNSTSSLSSRNPANTTVNTAIVAGNVPTTTSAYSGGVENFPRLLENWSGSLYLTIHGSFGLLYDSEQATGVWKSTGNYYNAPSRRWFFDTSLQDKNPPGFPLAYTYGMGAWAVSNR